MDYELTLEGMKRKGYDFSCGLTFPVGDKAMTLILGVRRICSGFAWSSISREEVSAERSVAAE